MSCLPGTPCYTSTIHTTGGTTGGCGLDPCVTLTLGSGAVKYVGPALSCSGISTCDTLTVALQKLDDAICNAPAVNILANNGLTKTGNLIQLGGVLIEQTSITTSFANTLSLINLVDDITPDYFITQQTDGVLRRSDFDDITDLILSNLTFDNGLTRTGDNTRLGGSLVVPTTIVTSPTNTISITNLVSDPLPDFIVTENTAGVVKRISRTDLGALFGTPVLADNGLNKVGNTVKLGGTLISPTTIITDVTNTISITGLSQDLNPDFFVTETTAGVVKKISQTDAATLFSSSITADNGLTKTLNKIELGGTLIKNTTVELDGYNISIIDSTTPNKVSAVNLSGLSLQGTFKYVSLGNNSIPTQQYGTAIGLNNKVFGAGSYSFAVGVNNDILTATGSYAIGVGNKIATSYSGGLGYNNINDGYISHSIGYDLVIPSTSTGTCQVGLFNNVDAIDYDDFFGVSRYPIFSVGGGSQSGESPAERLNLFHVLKTGFIKSKDGYDSRSGERGILPPQWSDTGWVDDTASQTFENGKKYIILQYVSGDDFSNLVDSELWGESNTSGYTFIGNGTTTPTTWTTSQVAKIGRPTSPALGEMGFNLDSSCLEYWNGSSWCSLCCGV